MKAAQEELKNRKILTYRPYPKQLEFHNAGSIPGVRFRAFMAGNQLGKTIAGGAETSFHATGLYPGWWRGLTFKRAINAWFAGNSSITTRDLPQKMLFGPKNAIGTGWIPKRCIEDIQTARGIPGLIDKAWIKHASGSITTLSSRSYDQDEDKWQGETLDWGWCDEEMRAAIWNEFVPRLNAGRDGEGGCAIITATPLKGMSEVMSQFYPSPATKANHTTLMGINDVPEPPVGHYTAERKKEIIASYRPYEREARANGIPSLGSGPVFPVSEEEITVEPFEIPSHWYRISGIDFGWDHPTAAVHCVIDRDIDHFYVVAEHAAAEEVIPVHAAAIKPWGPYPVAWPHDGYAHDKQSGDALADQYRHEGVKMLAQHATHRAGGYGTEAGVQEILEAMKSGRFHVFSTCQKWFREFRTYHRKDGKIVKENDDLMSATRMAWMMRRAAKVAVPRNTIAPTRSRYNPMDRVGKNTGWWN